MALHVASPVGRLLRRQHESENNKPLGSEANEVLATGMFGR